jgi:hypothetical protein
MMGEDEQVNRIRKMMLAIADAESTYEAERRAAAEEFKRRQSEKLVPVAELMRTLAEAVLSADSQALRQRVIHQLYWQAGVKPKLIGDAFGLNEHKVHAVAGPLTELIPCEGDCGIQVKLKYRSHSERSSYRRNSKHRIPVWCDQCSARHRAKLAAEQEAIEAKNRKEAAAYCAEHGHNWIAGDFDEQSPTVEVFCRNWCGATREKKISAN